MNFAQDCCGREVIGWAASTGGYDKEMVQDVMLGAVEKYFGKQIPAESLEWLTDNDSAYRALETSVSARMLRLEPCTTAVRSPESNGLAESFVKTIKRDYINMMPKPDSQAGVMNLVAAFSHCNEYHPHSALGHRSPR
ncbi:TPA: DDE-type integrase/transposase/recombinase [Klebsiella quasipneumoniae subsp. similipneumoniae]|nr:DDE-type integrase/transposase/recombinase [Klebsiella quasipneumoniae subsp. similipneumoniae]HBT4732690.1 DDE-type integrase/transposase/recombinase [Klebsiella quasipneumoniae subsp. similipneumoniae]HBT4805307.1 DDE-type integrase/transposase/recombinase [Klebsiella quasipneumoniae subsp. similipneumoniae]